MFFLRLCSLNVLRCLSFLSLSPFSFFWTACWILCKYFWKSSAHLFSFSWLLQSILLEDLLILSYLCIRDQTLFIIYYFCINLFDSVDKLEWKLEYILYSQMGLVYDIFLTTESYFCIYVLVDTEIEKIFMSFHEL